MKSFEDETYSNHQVQILGAAPGDVSAYEAEVISMR